jgi:hypothetical protein
MKKEDLLCISNGMGKMEKIRSISTNTLTNDFCKKMNASKNKLIICGHCYSVDSLEAGRFPNQVKALQRNSDILGNKELLEKEIYQNYMFNDVIFRLQSHGDLINELHLKNLMAIVKANKWTTFALWTKRKNVIKEYFDKHEKPENLILVYSNPLINKVIDARSKYKPVYFDKVFNNVDKDYMKEKQNCTGQKCFDCRRCYIKSNDNTIIEAVKTNGRPKNLPEIVVKKSNRI